MAFLRVLRDPCEDGSTPGEALALKPDDVDLRGRTLNVERAISFGRIKATKTHERRTVDLTPELVHTLHRHLAWLKEEALRRGWGEPEQLFPNDAGRPQDKWVPGKAFRRTLKRAGLPAFRLIDANGRVLGMISDGDLIVRQRRPKRRPWWRLFFENAEWLVREYSKTAGLTVGEVMTSPALVISPAFGIETAAAILDSRQIRRLPVVRDGHLVGIVSRGDLIRALAASGQPPTT